MGGRGGDLPNPLTVRRLNFYTYRENFYHTVGGKGQSETFSFREVVSAMKTKFRGVREVFEWKEEFGSFFQCQVLVEMVESALATAPCKNETDGGGEEEEEEEEERRICKGSMPERGGEGGQTAAEGLLGVVACKSREAIRSKKKSTRALHKAA